MNMFRNLFKNGKNLLTRQHSNILSAAVVIMATVSLSALLGVIRNRLLISYFYHQPEILDAYWAAFRLPDMIFQLLVVGALSAAFIPVFSDLVEKNKVQANKVASTVINLIATALIVLSVLIFIFARPLSQLITSGFSDYQIDLMTNLTRIMIFAQLFFGISNFLTGIIQSHKRFLVPALSPLLYNIGIIIGIITLSERIGILGPAVGVILGSALHLFSQIPLSRTLGFRYSWSWNIKNISVKEIGRLMFPRSLALSVSQIEQTAIVFFATSLPAGSLTMIYIAQQLAGVPVRLFGIPIGQASLPFFAKEKAKNQLAKLAELVNNSLLEIMYLAFPASAIVLVLRIPLVRLAYGAGSFPWAATVTTGKLVAILSLAIVARSLTHLVIRVFYSLHNTKSPLFIAGLSTILSVGLSYFFIFVLQRGILGLAVAITIASIVEIIFLITTLFAQTHFDIKKLINPTLKMLTAALITTFSLWIPLRLLDQLIFDTTRTIPLILLTGLTFAIGLVIYLSTSYILKIEQLQVFVRIAKKIGNWQKALAETEEPLETVEPTV